MEGHTCASGGCRKAGTHHCGSCKTTWYCSKTCQKAHWKKHKLTCDGPAAYPPLRPGVFDFMRLPREVRDKVSSLFTSFVTTTHTNGCRYMQRSSLADCLHLDRQSTTSSLLSRVNQTVATDAETAWTCLSAI